MTTENSSNSAPAAPEAPAKPMPGVEKPKGLSSTDIYSKVGTAIVAAAPRALNSVIETLVNREVDKRATALLGGIELAASVRKQLSQVDRADNQLFGKDGKVISESYSKARLTEIKKLTEKLAKIEKVIDLATREDNPDFGQLYNLKGEIDKMEKTNAEADATV